MRLDSVVHNSVSLTQLSRDLVSLTILKADQLIIILTSCLLISVDFLTEFSVKR